MSMLAVVGLTSAIAFLLAAVYDAWKQNVMYDDIYVGDACVAGLCAALIAALGAVLLQAVFAS